MPDQEDSEYRDQESHLERLFSAETGYRLFGALDLLAKKGKESFDFAMDLLTELSTEVTGVKSFKVTPRPPMEVEVEIQFKKESNIPFKYLVAPLVEIESVDFGKQIKFQALIESSKKGLRINLIDGFSLVLNFGPLGRKTVEIKGSGILKRDSKNGIVLVTEINVPGLVEPLEIAIPLTLIFKK
ncbi:MAG: hypothetical protein KC777_04470 [Cyanobacteria bacterium HKST-UBA02]|nr:hypothetical protein [Cyanobacteria bacterium HKST-UBA02]